MLLLCYYWCKFLCTGSQKPTMSACVQLRRRLRKLPAVVVTQGYFYGMVGFPISSRCSLRNRRFEEAAFHPTCIGKNQWVQKIIIISSPSELLTYTPTTWYHNWVLQNLGYYILLLLHIDGKGHHYILNGDCLFIFCVKKCSCDCNMYICCYKCSFMFVECVYIRALACGKGIVK